MIKLVVKDKDENGVNVKYKSIMSNTDEHIAAMYTLYKEIKENTDYTDKEIFNIIVEYSKIEGGK
mgnify:CR=1 FL=1